MAVLAELLDPAGLGGAVVVSAVAGLAGVGQTTLAVQAGHVARARGWYQGGVLFIDLHGYDDQPIQPAQALDALLRALGILAERISPTIGERAALYRSTLAGITSPVLVIADNASSEAQLRPLLPGVGPHAVLVTSRHTLAGLGARLVDLTVLGDGDAIKLLDGALRAARPADGRITSDLMASGRLAGACGGLPLALRITAAILTADPSLTAAELADELGEDQERLERLAYDEGGAGSPSVAAAFESSCRRLDEAAARLFRLLAGSPGPDISTAAAAVLVGLPARETRRLLADLARAHLGDRANEAAALTSLGQVLVEVRRFEEGVAACQDSAAIFRETGDRHGEGSALNNLGRALVEVWRFEEAIIASQDAAVICSAWPAPNSSSKPAPPRNISPASERCSSSTPCSCPTRPPRKRSAPPPQHWAWNRPPWRSCKPSTPQAASPTPSPVASTPSTPPLTTCYRTRQPASR